jgi:nicotinamide-nucleotide amidase
MFDAEISALAEEVLDAARAAGLTIATAESCTGGLVAAALTSVAGSSDVFERGFVTYSNAAKADLLGVDPALIAIHGAVSHEVALAMATGAVGHSKAELVVSVTGIAGPGGGSPDKPVGLVYFGTALRGHDGDLDSDWATTTEARFGDLGRDGVRQAAVRLALDLLRGRLAARRRATP